MRRGAPLTVLMFHGVVKTMPHYAIFPGSRTCLIRESDFEAWYAIPGIDTSLWRVAWDGDEVAGSVMTFVWPAENEALEDAAGVRHGDTVCRDSSRSLPRPAG